MKTVSRNKVILLALIILFILPGPLAYFVYTHPHCLTGAATNRGLLLNPPVLMKHFGKRTQWRLILVSAGGCDELCLQQLDQLARVRLALGRRAYEVETWLLMSDNAPSLPDPASLVLKEHDIHLLSLPISASDGIYIANPAGYMVLSYAMTVKPDDVFHDIKQLLSSQ